MDLKSNISSEHQKDGDAKRPDDTMDRGPTVSDGEDNLGGNTDQDGATEADHAENLGANTEEENQIHEAVHSRGGPVDAD